METLHSKVFDTTRAHLLANFEAEDADLVMDEDGREDEHGHWLGKVTLRGTPYEIVCEGGLIQLLDRSGEEFASEVELEKGLRLDG